MSFAYKMLPKHTRAANYQICTLEKVIRQLSNFTKSKPIPDIPQPHRKPCRSLANLGFRVHAAGIPKRPVIPLQEETMHCVKQYLEHLPNRDKFDQPLVIPVRDALVATYDIPDLSPMHRVNAAARLRHRLRQLEWFRLSQWLWHLQRKLQEQHQLSWLPNKWIRLRQSSTSQFTCVIFTVSVMCTNHILFTGLYLPPVQRVFPLDAPWIVRARVN